MGYVYAILALIALGGGGYGVWTYNSALEENARLQEDAKAKEEGARLLREAIGGMERTLASSQAIATNSAKRAAKAQVEAGTLRQELERLKNVDKPSEDWANSPVPDGIRRLRREGAFVPASAAKVPSPADRVSGDTSPATK